ncbi:tRNA lysidine(34) synthetase TilS [Sinimarinibacterium sp. CAU 1509]|uniref:tRNA lysidine(34) synthetase TilS n=1 Tax=Sinimarinibacterium sp. CAU 1509 TaxID=2562283 RepID=UPI0010AC6D4D|nr:tRNA lysidine(34) synthetase TilS [Sinimarinibacterium sp. CAU 1509]TJY62097.1 tRNA lysidine(34) synthetase TilS [Sinimarinibacterium sp. CAU 1509]
MSTPLRLATAPVASGGTLWVAYSGGGDSTALLHLLRQQHSGRLRAVHVHHGLQPVADSWIGHCRRTCRELGISLRVLKVRVEDCGDGPEAAARRARYTAIAAVLRPGDVLATAHHLDDQAETVLLRAIRGTGISGLGAMAVTAPLAPGMIWRPLLGFRRQQLRAYLRSQSLRWVEDPQNQDSDYARVQLRNDVMPLLQRHFPQAAVSLARLAARAQVADQLLAELALEDLRRAGANETAWGVADSPADALDIAALRTLSPQRRRNLLYQQWRALGLQPPAEAWFERLDREVIGARSDATPVLRSDAGEVRRYRDRLFLMPALPPAPDAQMQLSWGHRRTLVLPPGCGELSAPRVPHLQVRFARGGERLKPAGDRHTRTLKQLCQGAGIPPWGRERMPLLQRDGQLLAIADFWHSAEALESGLQVSWRHAIPGVPSPPGSRSGDHPVSQGAPIQ